ncbi:hypothetical protein CUR178_07815 [Leishmania enriettii]|uniref:Uncharacterized protein n=1 Tax=Leishmania enriettii TaxID=5663 RepID=A0A836H0B1_LEIEN|nr:hypothetical protein CUR178_07815 [Leishmania enriettii]
MGSAHARRGSGGDSRDVRQPCCAESDAANPLCRSANPVHGKRDLTSQSCRQSPPSPSLIQPWSAFGVPDQQQQRQQHSSRLANGSTPAGRGGDLRKSSRRASVAVDEARDTPHHLSASPNPNASASSEPMMETSASCDSLGTTKPRLKFNEARDLLLDIFFPRQGELECVFSGFLTREDYARMRDFWAPFLTSERKDDWYLDGVMLSVLGKDRWRSWRQFREVMSASLGREEVLHLNQQRREYSNQLRERLMDLSGALVEQGDQRGKKGNLQTLLKDYNRHKASLSHFSAMESDGISAKRMDGKQRSTGKPLLSRTHSVNAGQRCVRGTSLTSHRQDLLSVSLRRLQTTASISFGCFDLIAARIPTAIVSSLPSQYFLNSVPVVYEQAASREKKVGDLDELSFFVSIESRRQLLNGCAPADVSRGAAAHSSNHSNGNTGASAPVTHKDDGGPIQTTQQLYSAVRHVGLVVTTACSSMVLTVLFQLADVLHERQAFRDSKAKAAQLGVSLEELIGREAATVRTYSGKTVEDMQELKRYAITGEMSLTVLTKQLVARFRSDNRAKIDHLRKRYANIFTPLEMIATAEEQKNFDVTQLLSGMALKLMFLTGGGQRSIVADDRRVPSSVQRITDDVALSKMLEVPILNRICWIACMMGMPIMSSHGLLAQKHHGKPLSFIEIDECCGVMRVLFQAVGALPCGSACPQNIKEWFPLFPFYAVNSEGKRVLMYLYTAQVTAIQRVPLTLQKDMTLLSFATAFKSAKGRSRVDISNYFFEPNFTVGYAHCSTDSSSGTANEDAARLRCSPTGSNGRLTPSASSGGASQRDTSNLEHMASISAASSSSLAAGLLHSHKRRGSLSSSGTSASCSTLMEGNLNIDAYTCVNPQMQLYLRCSNEATMRRHQVTELTPSVSATFHCSARELEADRPDIAPALHRAVPKLLPSEGFLVLRWTSGEPLVTFCAGDLLSVMAEHVAASLAGGGHETRTSGAAKQACTLSRRYFTPTPHSEAGVVGASDALMSGNGSATGSAKDRSGNAPAARARATLVTIGELEKHSCAMVALLTSKEGACGATSEDDPATMSSSSYPAPETAQVYHDVMHDILGVSEKAAHRIAVRWRVLEVLPFSPLASCSGHVSGGTSSGAATACRKHERSNSANTYHNEVVLRVAALDMPLAIPLRILTMGHERASMSVFTFGSKNDDTVCWSNPNLIDSIVNKSDDGRQDGRTSSRHALVDSMLAAAANGPTHPTAVAARGRQVPSGLLCDTEEALHNVFYSIGVLLGNAITNGVYFTAPIAPLAFLLMKKAMSSGDHSFKNFMWLEPADGNLLSPTLALNSAYEILNMSDDQYVVFLQLRGLANPDAQIFPVVHSLADEVKEDKALQQRQNRPQRSLNTSTSEFGYLKLIQAHNRKGRTFHRSGSGVHSFSHGAHAPVQDRLQEGRGRPQQPQAMTSRAPTPAPDIESKDLRYARLPSRREYISLYLVNDLTWSSVRRDGHGNKNKELWVSMARGFMTSSLAKSPLMTHCCSRVIQEVLCVPDEGEEVPMRPFPRP